MQDQLLTTAEAAKRLAVTVSYLEKTRVIGGGPEFLKLGRSVRYEPSALAAWVDSTRRRSTSDRGNSA